MSSTRPAATGIAILALILYAGAASGCFFRAQARTVPDMPALDAPPPPPRVVEGVDPVPVPPAEDLGRPVLPVEPAPRAETPKPEAPARSQPAQEAQAVPEEGPLPPAPTLQTTPPGGEVELEKAIGGLLARASANLNIVDYARLHPDAQAQYNQAKRFISQAEEAMASKNLPFAHNLADKAATLAAQLAGR
jgi:hypothetical protein